MHWIVKIFHHRRILLVILLIVFFLGFVTGFYTFYSIQKHAEYIAFSLSIITIFFSASGMISLFHQLIKQKHDEESALRLEFEKINSHNGRYYLRVKKNEKAIGEIKDAKGFITVKDTNIENISTVWSDNNKPRISISVSRDLTLFKIRNEENIIFYPPNPQDDGTTTELDKEYNDYKDREIIIAIGSSNALTFTYKSKIGNIIKENK